MIDSVFAFLGPILAYLAQQYGMVGTIIGYLVLFVAPLLSLLIELMEAVVLATASTKDDEVAARIKRAWTTYVLPVLEVLPHVNLPIAPQLAKVLLYVGKVVRSALAAIGVWKQQ